jgi:hypothetical protein
MSLLDGIFHFAAFFSVWLPVVAAILARRSPIGVRGVLAVSGVASGIYAAAMYSRVSHAAGHERGWGVLLIPFTSAALSFWIAFTGVCFLTLASYVVAGRSTSPPSLLACGLLLGSLALGIFVVFPFLTFPLR